MTGMPVNTAAVHNVLQPQLAYLHGKWAIYRQLFAASAETIELLNRTARWFFFVCHDVLVNDVLLTISRLTDPATTAGRDNASLRQLLETIDRQGQGAFATELTGLVDVAEQHARFARALRNRRIAHADLQAALKQEVLPPASREDIESAMQAIATALNAVRYHFEGLTTRYDLSDEPGDGRSLLRRLGDTDT